MYKIMWNKYSATGEQILKTGAKVEEEKQSKGND